MSENQKKMAKRLLEYLVDTNILRKGLADGRPIVIVETLRGEMRKEVWLQAFVEAVAYAQAEEIREEIEKRKKQNDKTCQN